MTLNKAPLSLPQLQNLIKRDPASYKDEFQQQYRHYLSNLELFRLKPNRYNSTFEELVKFISQVSNCYPEIVGEFPDHLKSLLSDHSTVLDQRMRMAFCRSLMMLRKKNIVDIVDLFQVFFRLLKCQDKQLRKTLLIYFITDVKNANANRRNNQVNSALQSFMYKMLEDNHPIVMKTAVDVMVSLYNKNLWNDARTVNAIAQACFSKVTKVVVTSLRFFCGKDEDAPVSSDSDSEEEQTAKQVLMGARVAKKTKKRQQRLDRAMKNIKKGSKKKKKQVSFNFSALHLIHDPQGFAEKLFRKLEKSTDAFEVKVLLMNLVSRLIGIHQLILLNFYPFLLRFLQPHQRDVTKILQYAAQAAHEMVPPESIEPLLKTLANNFITDRNAGEVMGVGLNGVREICLRCPLAMSEDLLSDLVLYKNHRDKSVKMAGHSLIMLFRDVNPEMLHKKFRGKPVGEVEPKKALTFGDIEAKDYIPGADILPEEGAAASADKDGEDKEEWESCSDGDDSDSSGEWIDISHSDDEAGKDAVQVDANPEERREKAAQVSQMRIFSQDDLKKLKQFEIQKQIGLRTPKGKKRSIEVSFDDEEDDAKNSGLVTLKSIEMVHKKRRHDKESRLATVMAGREGREKFGKKSRLGKKCEGASLSNKEKKKFKSFGMIKHKAQEKHKRSFRDKQIALRDALIKQKKMK